MSGANPKSSTAIGVIIAALSFLMLLASLNPEWHLWGFDFISIWPLWFRITLIAAILFLAVPQISSNFASSISNFISGLNTKQLSAFYFIAVSVIFILSFIFKSESHFLGDGYNVLGNIAAPEISLGVEPLEYLLHRFLAIFFSGPDTALNSYRLGSLLAFIIFFISLYFLLEDKKKLLIALAIALCFSSMQFFFGYAENYTFAFVLSFIFIALAEKDYHRRSLSISTVIVFLLSVSFHLRNFMFLPLLILLIFSRNESNKISAAITAGVVVLMSGLGALVFKYGTTETSSVLVPLIASPQNSYTIFSAQHIFDMLNILLLNFPLILLLPVLVNWNERRNLMFLSISIIPALLFTICVDPKIGAARDWDLLSVAAAPIMLAIISAANAPKLVNKKYSFSPLFPLFAFAILHTGGWILCNSDGAYSYSRVKTIVRNDEHYSVNYYSGYRNKNWANIVNIEIKDINEALRATKIRFQGDSDDTLNAGNLVTGCLLTGDTAYAVQFIRDNWHRFINSGDASSLFGATMIAAGKINDAEEIYRAHIWQGNAPFNSIYNYAVVLDQLGKVDSALHYYDRAYLLWKDAPFNNEFSFYLRCISCKKYGMALSGLQRISGKTPANYEPVSTLIIKSLIDRNYTTADSLLADILKKSGNSPN